MNWNGTPPAQQGPREVYAPDLAQRMDKLLTLYEKNLPKPNRLETVSYTASPVPFDTQNYRHSYLVLDTTVTLSVELTGKTYTLQLSEGVNRVDFAQGACVSCSAGCQAILIRSDDHYLSSGDVLLGPGGQPIGTSSYPMYVSVTGSNTNILLTGINHMS